MYTTSISIMRLVSVVVGLVAALLLLFPFTTHAYVSTGQHAYRVTNRTALYTISYSFGSSAYDYYMPIGAVRGLPWGSKTKNAGYEIRSFGATTTAGTAAALVLSNAPIVDGMYKVAKGTTATFTFVALYTAPVATAAPYDLHVEELPFYAGDAHQPMRLNPSELKYYVTPSATLGT